MYRVGFGDCFLVSLPRRDGSNYFILIDCGTMLGTPHASERMSQVASNITEATHGHVDLVVVTHEHWDHVSGFLQASEAFRNLQVGEVWLGWTEDPNDTTAQQLGAERMALVNGLRLSASRMQLGGDADGFAALAGFLEYFGAANGPSSHDALEVVRTMVAEPRYCRPTDPPRTLADPAARLYVLGPPLDQQLLFKTDDSPRESETYGPGLYHLDEYLGSALTGMPLEAPFGTLHVIPDHVANGMTFFREHYWAGESWRRIDSVWAGDASRLALRLDSATNNTCLVLAIELADGDVLLFPGDAQVGSWLSWQQLRWEVDGGIVSGPDLLRRTVLYKVGHHGSRNATLSDRGLALMEALGVALLPVDRDIARQRRWDNLPWPRLLQELQNKTAGALIQADSELPRVSLPVDTHPLYYEVSL
ncbi:MAG: MBL fold metallo-hydrolase [Chloroflexota bacterium]|nr:MBL fold metallo-hydrolase [Chloroflexota bacterium]